MKMLSVIEAGRHASPLIGKAIDSIIRCIDRCMMLIDDMSEVKSSLSKEAIASECVNEISFMRGEFNELSAFWKEFDEKLSAYKYRPRKSKKNRVVDLPGQQKLFDEEEAESSGLGSGSI